MVPNFRSYQLAIQFYRLCEKLEGKPFLMEQLHRAASSVVLNLGEGTGRISIPDRRRFYRMALGSVRECQAILDLLLPSEDLDSATKLADSLGTNVYKLCVSLDQREGGRKAGPAPRP